MSLTDRVMPYSVSSLVLTQARVDFALGMTRRANSLTVLTSHGDGMASMKLNNTANPSIPIEKGLQVNINSIEEIYITNLSSAGTIKLFTSYVY